MTREPRVHTINNLKYLTCQKGSHFGLREKRDRERYIYREREREERKANLSPVISWGFVGQNSAGQELKSLYAIRATHGYLNHKISLRSKV